MFALCVYKITVVHVWSIKKSCLAFHDLTLCDKLTDEVVSCHIKMRVSHQNESCLLDLSLLRNSREDGGKQGSSHLDEKLSF